MKTEVVLKLETDLYIFRCPRLMKTEVVLKSGFYEEFDDEGNV